MKKNFELEQSNVKSFKQLIKTPKKSVIARSEKQSEYIKALKENDISHVFGPAGTGKSFLAVSVAITLLMEKKLIELFYQDLQLRLAKNLVFYLAI